MNPLKPSVGGALREDYIGSPEVISPVADPSITSDSAKVQQATMIKGSAAMTPGYNKDEVERRFLKALNTEAIDQIFPGSAKMPPPPPDVKLQVAQLKEQGATQRQQVDLQARMQEFAIEMMEEQRVNAATITKLYADAQNASASAETEAAYAQVAMINAEISRVKTHNEQLNSQIDHLLRAAELRSSHHLGMKTAEKRNAPSN